MISMYGLDDYTINKIQDVFRSYEVIEEIILFGSRVKGTYTIGSDIDLCLKNSNLKLRERLALENKLDDLMLPYQIDMVIYEDIKNKALVDHIDRLGEIIYHS